MSQKATEQFPEIPTKRYFTIGEVSTLCTVKPHVLRYWEQEFPLLRPCKRRGNRRYYLREDVIMVRKIKTLLYEQGFTISGARMQLTEDNQKSKIKAAQEEKFSTKDLQTELEEILALLA